MTSRRKSVPRLIWAVLLTLFLSQGTARGQYVPVYGGPMFEKGVGGYVAGFSNVGGPSVNDQGVGIGFASYYSGSTDKGLRPIAWGPTVGAVQMQIMGTHPDGDSDAGSAIFHSSDGSIVGRVTEFDGLGNVVGDRVVRWGSVNSAPVALPSLPDEVVEVALVAGMNQSYLVGSSTRTINGVFRGHLPVRWENNGSQIVELGNLGINAAGKAGGNAQAVNSTGTAVGASRRYGPTGTDLGLRAVRWDAGQTLPTELLSPWVTSDGYADSYAVGIAEGGTAIGYATKFPVPPGSVGWKAMLWAPGTNTPTVLGDLASGTYETSSRARKITANGIIMGESGKIDSLGVELGRRVVRWMPDDIEPIELGVLSPTPAGFANATAGAINNSGAIVGDSYIYNASRVNVGVRATYWAAGSTEPLDLNTLIDPTSGWVLEHAQAISDNNGWIAGFGAFDPDGVGPVAAYDRWFVLQVPEPGTCMILMLAAFGIRRPRMRWSATHAAP